MDSMSSEEWHLRNLLAVIHRDGGHYTAEYGLAKSSKDAEKIVVKLIQASEDYEPCNLSEAFDQSRGLE